MKTAQRPFQFMASSTLVRITGLRATTLAELLEAVQKSSDASIFNHTFQSLEQHHFLTEGFSNDFAQWTLAACNEPQLAERLSALDIRNYQTLSALRAELVSTLEQYIRQKPENAYRKAFEPFYLCEAVNVAVPTRWRVQKLEEFCEALRHVSVHTIHYHFVAARLREPLTVNDFSYWLEDSLGLKELAERIDQLDIYTKTLDQIRQQIIEEAQPWLTS